jgi:hypothetical protein
MVHEMHTKINQIEDKIDTLLNTVYASGISTPMSYDEQEQQEIDINIQDCPKETDIIGQGDCPKETDIIGHGDCPNKLTPIGQGDCPKETDANGHGECPKETDANGHGECPKEQDANGQEPTPPPPSTPSPQVFQISDNGDIEVVIPHQIANYDLTEKHWVDFNGKIPAKLYEELEKLTLVKMKAEEECKHHPNDESRFLDLESLKHNYETLAQEAIECWTSHLRANYIYTEVGFDILKDKIPNDLLDKIKSLDARMHDTSDPEYGAESLSQNHTIDGTINELIKEAYNFYVLYSDKNPSDESNANCQDLFEEWGCLPSSDSESGSECEDKQKKKNKKKKKNNKNNN